MKNKLKILSGLLYIFLSLSACSKGDSLAGGGTEVPSEPSLTGIVYLNDSLAEGFIATLYPQGFNPLYDEVPDSLRKIVNSEGAFRFKSVSAGNYNLYVFSPEFRSASLIQSIEIPDVVDTLITLSPIQLLPTATLTLVLTEIDVSSGGALFIPGTGFSVEITPQVIEAQSITFESLPASRYSEITYSNGDSILLENLLTQEQELTPGISSVLGPYTSWQDTLKVFINTSPTGSDVMNDLVEYPLLVRLSSEQFDQLSTPNTGPNQIRFSKSDGVTVLAYEIERWDANNHLAEIWVKLDTLHGNNSNQFIYLFAGNTEAVNRSKGEVVFDTSNSYTAVWHLNETPDETSEDIQDRTYHNYHGTSYTYMDSQNQVDGIIGSGLRFDGQASCIELPASELLMPAGKNMFTFSAWVLPDSVYGIRDSIEHRILSIKGISVDSSEFAWGISNLGTPAHYSRDIDSVLQWTDQSVIHQASYLTLVISNGVYRGYINGILEFSFATSSLVSAGPVSAFLGCHKPGLLTFSGILDEVNLSNTVRSPDWIKMNYESQKNASNILTWEY